MGRRTDLALSRELIASTALDILDADGIPALTVRRIAARLGVRSPSLYNHVRSKDEILDAITELIGHEIDHGALEDPDWRAGITAFARSYRRAFRAHPAALALIAQRAVETEPALHAYDAALGRLLRAGWPPAEALELMAGIDYLVLGSALLPFVEGFVRPAGAYADRYPSLSAALGAVTAPAEVDDAGFERGLAALLHRDPPRPCPWPPEEDPT